MGIRWISSFVAFALLGAIAACSTPAPETSAAAPTADPAAPTDTAQNPEATSDRIIALTSLTADIIHTLDPDRLVGIPGSSILRADGRFADLEIVSEGRVEPDLEKIVALQPDLVIGAAGFHDRTLARLQELGIDTLAVNISGWDALMTLTDDLAARLDADATELRDRYDACLAQAETRNTSTLVLVSRQPILSPNKNSWAGDFLTRFNLQNLTADLQGNSDFDGYVTLSEEKVLTTNPDVLLVVETEENLLDQLKGDPFWGQLSATQNDQVYPFDYFGLINPGSLASIEATCQQLADL